ncbi:ABC transporter permease [Maribacter sp. 2210JD10-5]|uniref:ABC transporter permease n=1 Tax=Maribacter sp. 2210JD10-5 TaxID=3386272 RepID=UPI0039BD0EC5
MKLQLIKAVLRDIWRRKFLSTAKILGLIVGFVVFIFLTEKINYEKSYDGFWSNADSIYRVGLDITYENGEEVKSAKNFPGASELLKTELDEVAVQCNIGKDVVTVFNGPKQKIQDVDFVWSDPTFFDVFDREIIASESISLLENIHGVAISESFAKKLYGDEKAIGKELTVNEGWKYVVSAVFEDIPENSHLQIDMVANYKTLFYYMQNFDNAKQVLVDNPNYTYSETDPYMTNRWRSPIEYRPYGYIKLNRKIPLASLQSKSRAAVKKVALPQILKDAKMDFIFQPIKDIHLKSDLDDEWSVNGSQKQVLFLWIINLVVLLVCIINFISLNTISTIESMKNYSIRMLNGSRYDQVFQIMFLQSLLLNILALCISLPLGYKLIAVEDIRSEITITTLLSMAGIVLTATLIACTVPFLFIVRNKAFLIVRSGSQKLQQKWINQRMMVIFQFSITIILIIATMGIYKQMDFMMGKELGFTGDQTVFSYTPMTMNQHPELASRLTTFKNEVSALSGVVSFSSSSSIPGKIINRSSNEVKPLNEEKPYPVLFDQMSIDEQFIKTYRIPLLVGENLNAQNDWSSKDILINESAISKMGVSDPIEVVGTTLVVNNQNYKIRGVVKDYHHTSLHTPVRPTIFNQNLQWDHAVGFYSFQLSPQNMENTIAQIADIWNRLYPKEEFVFNFTDAQYAGQYLQDKKFSQILGYTTILALFISCLGLLGIALFNIKKRIKEIGIRKVNGARTNQILVSLNMDFMKWVIIAYVIACPLACYILNQWLNNFAYKTSIGPWVYFLSGIVAIGMAILTVSWQSYNAAIANPIKALREE